MKRKVLNKILSFLLTFSLIFQQTGFAQGLAQLDISRYLGAFSSPQLFRPVLLRYFSYNPSDDTFQLLLDKGTLKGIKTGEVKEQGQELLKYFLTGVVLPDENFWVNLRPDSEDEIITDKLSQTDLGRVLLEADLKLKQDVSRFTSPETAEGREYWNKLYQKAGELFSSENITIPTLTRPWIVPGEVIIRENETSAYAYKGTLKVMLEQDYLKKGLSPKGTVPETGYSRLKELNEYSSQLIRETIIPKLTKEVNSSKRYAALRQVFFSLILSRWFKNKFAGQKGLSPSFGSAQDRQGTVPVYVNLIDSGDLTNLTSKEPWSKSTYFEEYKKSFAQGEYNLKEQVNGAFGPVIRSYFSGGVAFAGAMTPQASSPATDPGGLYNGSKREITEVLKKGLFPLTQSNSPAASSQLDHHKITQLNQFLDEVNNQEFYISSSSGPIHYFLNSTDNRDYLFHLTVKEVPGKGYFSEIALRTSSKSLKEIWAGVKALEIKIIPVGLNQELRKTLKGTLDYDTEKGELKGSLNLRDGDRWPPFITFPGNPFGYTFAHGYYRIELSQSSSPAASPASTASPVEVKEKILRSTDGGIEIAKDDSVEVSVLQRRTDTDGRDLFIQGVKEDGKKFTFVFNFKPNYLSDRPVYAETGIGVMLGIQDWDGFLDTFATKVDASSGRIEIKVRESDIDIFSKLKENNSRFPFPKMTLGGDIFKKLEFVTEFSSVDENPAASPGAQASSQKPSAASPVSANFPAHAFNLIVEISLIAKSVRIDTIALKTGEPVINILEAIGELNKHSKIGQYHTQGDVINFPPNSSRPADAVSFEEKLVWEEIQKMQAAGIENRYISQIVKNTNLTEDGLRYALNEIEKSGKIGIEISGEGKVAIEKHYSADAATTEESIRAGFKNIEELINGAKNWYLRFSREWIKKVNTLNLEGDLALLFKMMQSIDEEAQFVHMGQERPKVKNYEVAILLNRLGLDTLRRLEHESAYFYIKRHLMRTDGEVRFYFSPSVTAPDAEFKYLARRYFEDVIYDGTDSSDLAEELARIGLILLGDSWRTEDYKEHFKYVADNIKTGYGDSAEAAAHIGLVLLNPGDTKEHDDYFDLVLNGLRDYYSDTAKELAKAGLELIKSNDRKKLMQNILKIRPIQGTDDIEGVKYFIEGLATSPVNEDSLNTASAASTTPQNPGAASPVRSPVRPGGIDPSTPLRVNSPGERGLGGIDFRVITTITQPMGNLSGLTFSLPHLSNLENINLDEELGQIQRMLKAGIILSGGRLKEYVAACYQKGELKTYLEGIVGCLVDMCRLEEENALEASNEFKEVLLIIDAV